ncbi:ankyrin repeat domain-containing protein [Leptolyngbya sp. GGD]|uniref:ankyrin repeat domain-containing protein n=1 Tax=Leptolyngbya sp. GGD TaxID=2997907 RepID=UPI00227AF460|nr:ankyrin repeat domain-containing protein [Leptolyngbya sp. GGD]MCY6488794.1 ankyrin repeat domain-containing protein [Leptolyngbya sp. GGD]
MSSNELSLRDAIANLVNRDRNTPSQIEQVGDLIQTITQAVVGKADSSDVNATEVFDALSQAVHAGQTDVLRELVAVEAQTRQKNQPTLLMSAVMAERTDIVRALVEVGADVNVRINQFFDFDAMEFALERESLEIVKILIAAGADLNWNPPMLRPVTKAINKGNLDLLKILLEAGAEVVFETGYNLLAEAASKTNKPEIVQRLLGAGCPVNSQNSMGDTALVDACLHGNDGIVQVLLDAGADPDLPRQDGLSPLIAVFSAPEMAKALSGWGLNEDETELPARMVAILRSLVKAGANLDIRDYQGRTALMVAATQGNLDFVNILLAGGADPSTIEDPSRAIIHVLMQGLESEIIKRSELRSALHYAADHGHTDVVQALLAAGADVTILDKKGRTARDIAIQQGYTEIVRLLKQAGTPIPAGTEEFSEAFLLGAAKQGNLEDLRSALRAGINPNASEPQERRSPRHKTALMFAAERGHLEAVQILIETGAEVNLSDRPGKKLGKTPLMYAAESDHAEIIQFLIKSGATVDAQDKRGETALFLAVQEKSVEAVRVLLEFGADPHKKNWDGTPFESATYAGKEISTLMTSATQGKNDAVSNAAREEMLRSAAFNGNAGLVKTLIQEGVNIDIPESRDGWTALMYAAAKGETTIVQLLIAAGANVNHKSREGKTAMSEARYWGHHEVIDLLRSAGAEQRSH